MNKVAVILFALVQVVTSYACAEQDRKGSSSDSSRKVVSQRWGYSISCPQDWKVKTYPRSTNLVKADLSKGDVGISLRIYTRSSGQSFEAFLAGYLRQFEKDMQGHHRSKLEEVGSGGFACGPHQGRFVRYQSTRRKGSWLLKEYLIPRPGTNEVFVFQAGCKWDKRGQAEKQLDAVVASLRLLDQSSSPMR